MQKKFKNSNNIGVSFTFGFFNKPFSWDDYNNVKQIIFEGTEFLGFSDNDKFLTEMYGSNYMELPPVSKREKHILSLIDFGQY
jgi:phosphorylcholine metabolism protein LicD